MQTRPLTLAALFAAATLAGAVATQPAPGTCTTDSECEWLHEAQAEERDYREIQCRQEGQSDWVSVQLNVEFDCYGWSARQ